MRKRVSALLVLVFMLSGCSVNDSKTDTTTNVETTDSSTSTDTTKSGDVEADAVKATEDAIEASKDDQLRQSKLDVAGEKVYISSLISEDGKTLDSKVDTCVDQLKGTEEKVKKALDYLNNTKDNLKDQKDAIDKLTVTSENLKQVIDSCEKNGTKEEKLEKIKTLKDNYDKAVRAILKVTKA